MHCYNVTSTVETHWPAVPAGGWLLAVDMATRRVIDVVGRAGHVHQQPGGTVAGQLQPWLNPWSNGQKLPAAPDCTMVSSHGGASPTLCKLPYCGESVRPVAAQQFNVLQLGGRHVYYGERWQSTPTGLKAHDFSYMEPLRFDSDGVVQRLSFADSFTLPLPPRAPTPPGTVVISNALPRLDTLGKPVNAHSGNVVKMGDTFFLYGEWYGTGPYTVVGETALPRLSVYHSHDMVNWKFGGLLHNNTAGRPWADTGLWPGGATDTGTWWCPWAVFSETRKKIILWWTATPGPCCDAYWGVAESSDGIHFERKG